MKRNIAMKKKYMEPSFMVVELQQELQLLAGTERATPPEEIPDYDDWLGARKFSGTWEAEDDREE